MAAPSAPTSLTAVVDPTAAAPTFTDNFNTGKLDTSKWLVSTWAAPGTETGVNNGIFSASAIDMSQGMLCLKVTQVMGSDGKTVQSTGAEIQSNAKFGYGTYEMTMRMGSTSATPNGAGQVVSGSDSSFFTFFNNSETELDIEFLGSTPNEIWLTNWVNPTPTKDPTLEQSTQPKVAGLADGFHDYKMVWAPGVVTWYIDGVLVATHTQNVPSTPAFIMFNHWGTNDASWGGAAVLGTTRYQYVKSISFTPAGS